MFIRKLLLQILISLLALFGSWAESSDSSPIQVGVVYGLTGAAEVWGDFGKKGLELARDEINDAGGVNGHKLELIFEDSKTSPAGAVAAYRKLTKIDKVEVVIGDVWSFLTNAMIPLATKDQVVLISPTAMPEAMENTSPYFFTMGQNVSSIQESVDLFFKNNPEVKKIGILCWDDSWGQGYLKVWTDSALSNGVEIEIKICNVDFANDFRSDVTRLASKKVDAVIIAHMSEVVLQRMKEQNFSPKVLASSNIVEDIKIKRAKPALFEGVYFTDWQPKDEFAHKFKEKYGVDPAVEAHNSYESLQALVRALSLDTTDILTGLRTVQYEGVAGPVNFSNGFAVNSSQAKLYQVQEGNFVLVQKN